MPVADLLTRMMPLSVWAAGAAALLLFAAIVTVQRARGSAVVIMFGGVAVFLAGALAAWVSFDWDVARARSAERLALDRRISELNARAIAPHSPLACLDAIAGDAVESACEKAVFASPETVAAAVSYVAARLALLADGVAHVAGGDVAYEASLAPTRLALETDRFGIVAHIFAVRDSCTALQCDSLALLRAPGRVEANLRERTFETYVGRHAAEWSTGERAAPTADAGGSPALASTGAVAPTGIPVPSRYDFPSAASIPPVSIMNPEPGPREPARASVASMPESVPAPAGTPIPPHRPPQAPRRATPAHPAVSAPVQLAPPASGGSSLH